MEEDIQKLLFKCVKHRLLSNLEDGFMEYCALLMSVKLPGDHRSVTKLRSMCWPSVLGILPDLVHVCFGAILCDHLFPRCYFYNCVIFPGST